MMFSVPTVIAVYCSSSEALVAGNWELLFLYNKKQNLLQEAGKYKNTERGCVGTTEQGTHCSCTWDVQGEIWPLLSNHWVRSWTGTGCGSTLNSPGVYASWYLWAALGWSCPLFPLLPLFLLFHCSHYSHCSHCSHCSQCSHCSTAPTASSSTLDYVLEVARLCSNIVFPFLFCKNVSLLSLSKWEVRGRRIHHLRYLSYSELRFYLLWRLWCCEMTMCSLWEGKQWKTPIAAALHCSSWLALLDTLLDFSFWSLPYTWASSQGSGPWEQLLFTHIMGLSSKWIAITAFLTHIFYCCLKVGLGIN